MYPKGHQREKQMALGVVGSPSARGPLGCLYSCLGRHQEEEEKRHNIPAEPRI